jgi:hypothetical protein
MPATVLERPALRAVDVCFLVALAALLAIIRVLLP